jgi:hypothetical protein
LWNVLEPLHAVVYFDPRPTDALKAAGLRGGWMCYFAGRFAPVGAVGPAAVTAMAFGFAPGMVARALPDAWSFAPPETVTPLWAGGAAEALRDAIAGADQAAVEELNAHLADAVDGCRCDGRPLAAGWAGLPVPDDPFAALWLRTTVLREHRGDGHVLAAVAAGLSGLQTTLSLIAAGGVTRELLQRNRGWTDDEWDEATAQLVSRGLLDRDGALTDAGAAQRRQIEAMTDDLAAGPVDRIGADRIERFIELATPLCHRVIDGGALPVPNPIGVPRP